MFQKVRESKGLTLVEMLCATLILILLTLVLNTGMQMALESYRRMVLHSEVNLLLSSLSDAVADELRYASDVTPIAPGGTTPANVTYNSLLYGKETKLSVGDGTDGKNNGQIYAILQNGTPIPVLPDGSYGRQPWIYGIPSDGVVITYHEAQRLFEVTIKVSEMQADGSFSGFSAEQTFNIRCLNQ